MRHLQTSNYSKTILYHIELLISLAITRNNTLNGSLLKNNHQIFNIPSNSLQYSL